MQISSAGNNYAAPTARNSASQGAASQNSAAATPAQTKADTAVADFMAFANMTPAQKMRAIILGDMKLTENDLKAMDEKERAKIEDKIKRLIQQQVQQSVEKKTGVVVDLKA